MRIGILSLMGLFCLISSVSAQDITLPYFEDFESATVGDPGVLPTDWINASEGTNDLCTGGGTTYQNCLDWGVNSGGTASSNTGPSGDHTTGSGIYVFVEASGNSNTQVNLLTPTFDLAGSSGNLTFWIHNFSSSTGQFRDLDIDVLDASGSLISSSILNVPTTFSINDWRQLTVALDPFSNSGEIRLRFRWNLGTGSFRPDIAIDDVEISVVSTTEICGNTIDDDADGLIDCLDTDCDSEPSCDTDSDGVIDRLDIDDDNDGVTDALECYGTMNLIINPGFESGNSGFSSDYVFRTCTSDCGPDRDVERGEYAIEGDACRCGAEVNSNQEWIGDPVEGNSFMITDFDGADDVVWSQTLTVTPFREYSFSAWVLNISFFDEVDPRVRLGVSTNSGATYTIIGTSTDIRESNGWTRVGYSYQNGNETTLDVAIISFSGGGNGREIALDGLSFVETNCDSDADGVPNIVDLDSDNDGIYDAIESSSNQSQSGGRLNTSVDPFGLPNSVTDNMGSINYIIADSDVDGNLDLVELESDGDGCFDTFEENIDDPDNNGVAGIGLPSVDDDGLVQSITYTTPTNNTWQNPGVENPSCDGDTDGDGIADVLDLDDDNDGIPDEVENSAFIDFSGNRTLLVGTDETDLLVGDKIVYEDAVFDCDNIFYDVVLTVTDVDGVVLSADVSGLTIDNSNPSLDDYATFSMQVVESGSATVGNPAGTPASIDDFVLIQRDIDSTPGTDFTEVVGVSDATPPEDVFFTATTSIEEAGFVNGGGPSGFTEYRLIALGGPTPFSSYGALVGPDELDPNFGVFLVYDEFSFVELIFGITGSANSNLLRITRYAAQKDCDLDGDGIANSIDLDSDNDGIYDLHEAGHSFTLDLDNDGIIDGSDTASGLNGLFDQLETATESGLANYTFSDSDSDSIRDFFELDSDDDDCFDTREADVIDDDFDGTAGTGVPVVDVSGRVTIVNYEAPPTNQWQNPLQSCLEICDNGLDDDNDGLIDDFDPDCADFFLEAECGFPGDNWIRSFSAEASNNDFQTITPGLNSLDVPPTGAADILRFSVTIEAAGTYRILGRVRSQNGGDDSFWFRVDEGTWINWNDWDTAGEWLWREFTDNDNGNVAVPFVLGIGNHTIDIAYREDGAGLDKLHLTINGGTPEGIGEEAFNCFRSITTNLFLNYKIRNRNN